MVPRSPVLTQASSPRPPVLAASLIKPGAFRLSPCPGPLTRPIPLAREAGITLAGITVGILMHSGWTPQALTSRLLPSSKCPCFYNLLSI